MCDGKVLRCGAGKGHQQKWQLQYPNGPCALPGYPRNTHLGFTAGKLRSGGKRVRLVRNG
jgi:hypothetical protein